MFASRQAKLVPARRPRRGSTRDRRARPWSDAAAGCGAIVIRRLLSGSYSYPYYPAIPIRI